MYMIYGYPKVGNTWLQVMLIYILDPSGSIAGNTSPRGDIFSHGMPGFNTDRFNSIQFDFEHNLADKNIILMIRNPGDTLVSLYMHNRYRNKPPLYASSIDNMTYDPVYGIKKYIKYYQKWDNIWHKAKSIHLIRYEDLRKKTQHTLWSVLNELNIDYTRDLLAQAVNFGSFENMKKLEDQNHLRWPTLAPSQNTNTNARKVREGKIGNYKKMLAKETVEYINQYINELPERYGYKPENF